LSCRLEQHDLAFANEVDRGRRKPFLGFRGTLAPRGEGRRARRWRQRAAMHPLHEASGGELAQVPADRVLGGIEFLRQLRRNQPAVTAQPFQEPAPPLLRGSAQVGRGQHKWVCVSLHDRACFCTIIQVWSMLRRRGVKGPNTA
jgi:hypothetical protein